MTAASVSLHTGDFDRAAAILQELLARGGLYRPATLRLAHLQLALASAYRGDVPEGQRCLELLTHVEPSHADSVEFARALLLLRNDRLAEALGVLDRSLTGDRPQRGRIERAARATVGRFGLHRLASSSRRRSRSGTSAASSGSARAIP